MKVFVDEKGMVDYKKLRPKRVIIRKLLNNFDNLDRSEYDKWSTQQQLALWINAYNLQSINIIIQNYPIKSSRWFRLMYPPTSIRHIQPVGKTGSVKWDQYKFSVMDEEFTLSEIERRFFVGEFNSPQVYFAISQVSMSGPALRNEPYYGYKLAEQLTDQVKKYIASQEAFKINHKTKVVYLSSLFEKSWYGRYFIGTYYTDKKFKDQSSAKRAALNFLLAYLSSDAISFLERENYTIKYIAYDWRLNE